MDPSTPRAPTHDKGIVLGDLSGVAITQEDGPMERGRDIPTAGIGSEPDIWIRGYLPERSYAAKTNGKSIPHSDGVSSETRGGGAVPIIVKHPSGSTIPQKDSLCLTQPTPGEARDRADLQERAVHARDRCRHAIARHFGANRCQLTTPSRCYRSV